MSIFDGIFNSIYKQMTYYYVRSLEKTTSNDELNWKCFRFNNKEDTNQFL